MSQLEAALAEIKRGAEEILVEAELVAKLNKAVNAALAQPDLKKRYKELGYDEWTGSPQTLAERAAKERAMWATVTQGITVD